MHLPKDVVASMFKQAVFSARKSLHRLRNLRWLVFFNLTSDLRVLAVHKVKHWMKEFIGPFVLADSASRFNKQLPLPVETFVRDFDLPATVRDFLCRFDAIFSLNQDTLLEQKYQPSDFLEGSRGRWFGFQSPGLLEENIAGQPYARPGIFRPADPPFTLKERVQPYFKLHGSSNWRALNGSTILIMGQNKGFEIDNSPLLNWYRDQFREMLGQTGAHLMVIGYSFRDDHINQIIVKAAQKGLKLFIIDARGVDVIDPESKNKPGGLKHLLQDSIIGASRRYLLPTISTDPVEFKKILRFFPSFP
jgi:hypothetical protein